MNGVHDMGGMQGMGPILVEKNEPVFHARWEARVIAIRRLVGASGKLPRQFPRLHREYPGRRLSAHELLRKMVHGDGRTVGRERRGNARRNRQR